MTKYPFNDFILSAIAVKNAVSNCLPEGLCGLLIIKNDGCTSSIFVKMVSKSNVKSDPASTNAISRFTCAAYA